MSKLRSFLKQLPIEYLIFIFIILPITSIVSAQTTDSEKHDYYKKIANEFVRTALIEQKGYLLLSELCALGPRLSGSENSLKAIQWAKFTMEKLGFDHVTLQPVKVPKWVRGDVEKAEIAKSKFFKGKKLNIAAYGGSIGTPSSGITAEVLEVKTFDELHALGDRAKGKIIFFNRPMDWGEINTFAAYGSAVNQRSLGAIEAAKAGGVAAIVRSVTTKYDNEPHVGAMHYLDNLTKIPSVAIGLKDADFLSAALKKDPSLKVKIQLSCKTFPDVQSYNVIGDLIGSEKPEEVIVVGGHFDSWDKGEGAHDDGAGCIQSMEVLNLFQRLGIKPKRTIRCVFFINEENGLRGAIAYGQYADKNSNEIHIAAIESDRGAFTPRGFSVNADSEVIQKINSWLQILQKADIEWVRPGGSGADISQIKNCKVKIGYVPDSQRYFDLHHSAHDVFSAVHPRELELGSAAIAILAFLISEEGL